MKLTAFMTSTTASTVMAIDIHWEPTVMPPIGRDVIATPCQARRMAARIWPASFVIQSRSMKSSMTPIRTMRDAAPTRAQIRPGCSNTSEKNGIWEAAASASNIPTNMATPPSLGLGVVCTSRSRTGGYHLYRIASRQTP